MICASYTRQQIMFGEALPIAEQNEQIKKFLKSRRLQTDMKFSDRRADVNAEEGFMEMKEAGVQRRFDCIVIWSMMYFGKDPLVGYNLLKHTFLPAGLEFAVVCDNFFSIGKTVEEIEAYLESKYRERRAAHYQGIKWIAENYRMNTLYGYEKHGGEFIIDREVEPIVRKIHGLALEKRSVSEIVALLNQERIEGSRHYLRRMAERDLTDVAWEWDNPSVKKILTDSRYKGERTVTRNGVADTLPIPAYISTEEYNSIQGIFQKRNSQKKWENPLTKRIFDKDTHIPLSAGNYTSKGKRQFFLSRQAKEIRYEKKTIHTEAVLDEVLKQIRQEQVLAKRAAYARMTESGKLECERRKVELQQEIESVFSKLLETVAGMEGSLERDMCSEAVELDSKLKILQEKRKELDVAYGEHNPWIELYSTMEVPEELTTVFCTEAVAEVLVERFERVEVIPRYAVWKKWIPVEWLEEQYGKKESKE